MDRYCDIKLNLSFVFFSGSCYGGHYHAYIRDVEGLGMWCEPVSNIIIAVGMEIKLMIKPTLKCGRKSL